MSLRKQKRITRGDLRENCETFYVFGDNAARAGFGGQAKEMRDEPNAIGIRTKKRPALDFDAYLTDKELLSNLHMIFEDYMKVITKLHFGYDVVFPTDGIGTGRAELETRAPKTYAFIKLMEEFCEKRF